MNILWIKDGKVGHEKQVKALLDELSKSIVIHITAYKPEGIETFWFKYFFKPGHSFASSAEYLDLKAVLWDKSFDIIIGAGRKSHWHILRIPNIVSYQRSALSHLTKEKENNINVRFSEKYKKIAILFPSSQKEMFDIICTPIHDKNKIRSKQNDKTDNIIFYEGSLANVSNDEIDENIGLIGIGGKNKHYVFNENRIIQQIEYITALYPNKLWHIFSSRRTSKRMVKKLNILLSNSKNIILAENGFNEVIKKASIKVVTQDSMNMVYESLSTKGKTFLFNMKYFRKNKVTKQINQLLLNKQVGYMEYSKMVDGLYKIKMHKQNEHHEVFAEVEKLAYKLIQKIKI